MDPMIIYLLVFAALTALVFFLNAKYGMLRDESTRETKKPYSYARTQLTWWSVILLSGYVTVILNRFEIPTFTENILILLGISSATTITARITDISDQNNTDIEKLIQNSKGENFIVDILSDKAGVSIHRLQAVVFNIAIGLWFIFKTISNLGVDPKMDLEKILPDIEMKNLILMGLSAGTYAALKMTENKGTSGNSPDPKVGKTDEKNENEIPPVG